MLISPEELQWFSYIILLDGLLIDIFGVIIIQSVEYPKIQDALHKFFNFHRAAKIRDLRSQLYEDQATLRDDSDFDSEGDSRIFSLDIHHEINLLTQILFPDRRERIEIESIEWSTSTNNPNLSDIQLKMVTNRHENLVIETEKLEQWCQRAIDYSYYREGGKIIIIGFSLIFISTLLEILAFIIKL